jgi:hypothetical protein
MDPEIQRKTDNSRSSGSRKASLVWTGIVSWNDPRTLRHLITPAVAATLGTTAISGGVCGSGATLNVFVICLVTTLKSWPLRTVAGTSMVINPAWFESTPGGIGM